MDKRDTIIEELRGLSPAVANILRRNVYTVPFDYFDKFSTKVISLINQKEQHLPLNNATPFSVPGGYFETLASKILDKAKQQSYPNPILDELKKIAPTLLSISKKIVWNVPTGYFESLAEEIQKKIRQLSFSGQISKELLEVAPLINNITSKRTFTVPANYFEVLADEILQKVRNYQQNEIFEELREIAPLLNTISKEPVFTVPQGYFEGIKVSTSAPAARGKVRSMFTNVPKMVKYAAAAVIGGILVTGSIVFIDNEDTKNNNINPTVQNTKEIEVYKPEVIKTLSNEEIKEYLSSSGARVDDPIIIVDDQDDLEGFLKEMTEEEIKQFLQENSEPSDLHFKEG